MKRAIIIHCLGERPQDNWYFWLRKELEKKGYTVDVPLMPNTAHPKITAWVKKLKDTIKKRGKPNEETFLIGHSVGCQTIMRYLEKENAAKNLRIGGIIFVTPWLTLTPVVTDSEEEGPIVAPWLDTKIDFSKITSATKNITAIFSNDDLYVPKENTKLFKELLHARIIIEKNKGHYDTNSGTKNVPEVLKCLNTYKN